MAYSSFSKLRILQLRRQGKRAPSIAAVLKRKVFKVTAAGKRAPSIVAMLKREIFKVTTREFTTLSGGVPHMELFVCFFFLRSLFYSIGYVFILLYYYRLL